MKCKFAKAKFDSTGSLLGILLFLHVRPGAKQSALCGAFGEDRLAVQIAAPPRDGEANDETVAFISQV